MTNPSNLGITCSIPEELENKLNFSDVYINYTKAGNPSSFGIDIELKEMHLQRTCKARELDLLPAKIESTVRVWKDKYQRFINQKKKAKRADTVAELNESAQAAILALEGLLERTLHIDDAIDWSTLKRKDVFIISPAELARKRKPPEYIKYEKHGRPTSFFNEELPTKPNFEKIKARYGFFSKLFLRSKIQEDFESKVEEWKVQVKGVEKNNIQRQQIFDQLVVNFEKEKQHFMEDQQRANAAVDDLRSKYAKGDPSAVEEYCELVLSNSVYPDVFQKNWILEFRPANKIVVVDYDLPAPDDLPTVVSYTYIKSKDEVKEKTMTAAAHKKLYESVIYQTCIRTIHELFEADTYHFLDAVAFNGVVTNTNPATGILETKIIISISASKEEFMTFDLSKVDPKSTFKHLKGVSAASLMGLTPIPPVISLERTDKRFIDGKAVAYKLDNSVNLAAMDWEDFEHLVRELFEQEFTVNGGEVKVTQASSDGGVDAIAFDPDPIRGGKIVIQAKRYTNTVGVAAVRDLYGTVMNEGATKGILVTTSDFGADSYNFAKQKPITLLNGNNLLSLLEKHGHKARINVAEAKKMMAK